MTADIQRRGLLASLASRLPAASHDELRVIDRVLGRLELGRDRYGLLDLAKPRDWRRERFEERLDALVYDACEELALEAARAEMVGVDPGELDALAALAARPTTPAARLEHVIYCAQIGAITPERAREVLDGLAEWHPSQHETRVSDAPAKLAARDIDEDEPYAEWDVTDLGGEGG